VTTVAEGRVAFPIRVRVRVRVRVGVVAEGSVAFAGTREATTAEPSLGASRYQSSGLSVELGLGVEFRVETSRMACIANLGQPWGKFVIQQGKWLTP